MSQPVSQAKPSPAWELFKGFTASTVEVFATGQIFTYMKNQVQQGKPFSPDPKAWYRGVHYHAGCLAPVTAIQFAAFRTLIGDENNANFAERSVAALAAGAFAALPATAAEFGVQVATGRNIPISVAVAEVVTKRGGLRLFTTGLKPVMIRDALFVWGYKEGKGFFAEKVETATECNKKTANLAGAFLAGMLSSVVSQPFDAMRGRIQLRWDQHRIMSMQQSVRLLKLEGGAMAGWYIRGTRVPFAILIYETVGNQMEKWSGER